MVKQVTKKGKDYFQCEECEMFYKTRELAQKCGDFCRKNKSCSLEILKNAVEI